jgi:hypothetical protein
MRVIYLHQDIYNNLVVISIECPSNCKSQNDIKINCNNSSHNICTSKLGLEITGFGHVGVPPHQQIVLNPKYLVLK